MKNKLLLHLFAVLAAGLNSVSAQTFTYQGKLVDDCCPATGLYDLWFKVFDNAGPGSAGQQGPTVFQFAVPVTNGLFTVPLFALGSSFNGFRRWLQIDVRTNNSALTPVTLLPRTELTATPYAIYAHTAGTVTNGGVTSAKIASGQVVKSLNGLTDALSLVAGANVILTPSGNNIQISAAGPGGTGIWALNGSSTYYNGGNVGIGTASPLTPLDIRSPNAENQGLHISRPTKNTEIRLHVTDSDYGFLDLGGGTTLRGGIGNGVGSSFGGNVGIGTTSPTAKLDLRPIAFANNQSGGIQLATTTGQYASGMFLRTDSDGVPRLAFDIASSEILNVNNVGDGYVGIGTSYPRLKLHVAAPRGAVVQLSNTGGDPDPLNSIQGAINFGDAGSQGRIAYGTDTGFSFWAGGQIAMSVSDGNVSVKTLTINGADLAEPFEMSTKDLPKGSVVTIDEDHPGQLKLSDQGYDKRVAGILSGANGIRPGIRLKQEGFNDQGEEVALSGRVYALADASEAPIKPGDLLTTSATPGHCMKVTDPARAQGAIIGKAMSTLKEGKGMVLVLVSLQ